MSERQAVLSSLGSALLRLQNALAQPKTEWTRDAAIQRFEFTFELGWKAVRRFAKSEGLDVGTPREAFKTAMKLRWIDEQASFPEGVLLDWLRRDLRVGLRLLASDRAFSLLAE